MALPTALPAARLRLLNQIKHLLAAIPGVAAVGLGGSWASGLAGPDSDLDIGLYYRQAAPFPIDRVRQAASTLAAPGSVPVVTGLYEWGPWANGGAWIATPAGPVDFVYRNLDQVHAVIAEGQQGLWRHDFDQQPPFGFRSVVYFGESSICVPLHDPEGAIARLHELVAVYPEPLRHRVLQESLWGAEFSFLSGRGFAAKTDVCHTAACLTRAAHFLIQALFALNRRYFVSDKSVDRLIDGFPLAPPDFYGRLAGVLAHPGSAAGELAASLDRLEQLWREAVDLTAGAYWPRWGAAARDKLQPNLRN